MPDAENPAEELASYSIVKRREEVGALYPVVENPAKVFMMGCVVENLVFGIWLPSPRVTQILRKKSYTNLPDFNHFRKKRTAGHILEPCMCKGGAVGGGVGGGYGVIGREGTSDR